ncbi:MAG TPA: hypothetical protein VJM14_18535 [Burkholderiales bacterium]|nr:hypothetical protein [Burkholderiales bacterium]
MRHPASPPSVRTLQSISPPPGASQLSSPAAITVFTRRRRSSSARPEVNSLSPICTAPARARPQLATMCSALLPMARPTTSPGAMPWARNEAAARQAARSSVA